MTQRYVVRVGTERGAEVLSRVPTIAATVADLDARRRDARIGGRAP